MTRELRRAQLITPYGVGAVFDFREEGFVVKDISSWTRPGTILRSTEIRSIVGGKVLRALVGEDNESVPVERFPRWHYCSKCRNLSFWHWKNDRDDPDILPTCCTNSPMVPMRFVAVCDKGHLTEIDWFNWAHHGQQVASTGQCDRENMSLKFLSSGKFGGDFDQMRVDCKNCGAGKTLSDIQRKAASPGVVRAKSGKKCCGKQPWQTFAGAVDCDETMFIEPRGSSSIYRARVVSALDLANTGIQGPGDQDRQAIMRDDTFRSLVNTVTRQVGSPELAAERVAQGDYDAFIEDTADNLGVEFELVKELLIQGLKQDDEDTGGDDHVSNDDDNTSFLAKLSAGQRDIQASEFGLFSQHKDIEHENLDLSFHEFGEQALHYHALFSTIGQVRRLREVRCFVGFTRGSGNELVPADLGNNTQWLPAVEAFGEGIYLELREEAVEKWTSANGKKIKRLLEDLTERFEASFLKDFYNIEITAPFLLAHTLSHFLIRELTYQSGYPSSSLRERVYSDANGHKAGLLIYASDIDEAGTLGGLVEQGRPERLVNILDELSRKADWCSADPVCRELVHQGLAGLNNAACHCCSLISETSCIFSNVFLSRLLVSGNGKGEEPVGFLRNMNLGKSP